MKQQEENNTKLSQKNKEGRPKIRLSSSYMKLSTEAGKTFYGSFTVYSENEIPLQGKVLSTNDKVVLEQKELSGTECKISFYFKGKMALAGEEHYGDFLLISNGGEYNLPYCINVIPKKFWINQRGISNLKEFADFAREDWKRARDAFFTKEFKEVFLMEREEYLSCYQGLLKGRSRDVILDNFLQKTMGKKPVMLEWTGKEKIWLSRKETCTVVLTMDGWGSAEGKIYSKRGNLNVNKNDFFCTDFQEGRMEITLSFYEGKENQDELTIETVYQKISIPVERKYEKIKSKTDARVKKSVFFVGLFRAYVNLRTGKSSVEQYVKECKELLETEEKNPKSNLSFLELSYFQLLTIQKDAGLQEAESEFAYEESIQRMEEKRNIYLADPMCRNYFYYLMALAKKEKASILEAVLQIRDSFEKSHDFYDFWMLLYLDRNLALDKKTQCKELCAYVREGQNGPLLYLGLLDILNQNPYYLEELKEQKASVIGWGIRHGYLSTELSRYFAKMTTKEKFFQRNLLNLLKKLYEIRRDETYLMAICSMLIKGNKTQGEYHCYFEQALGAGLKIVGLNEYYLRSLDFSSYPILPKSLLLYFNYSNSLDEIEKAYLYTNILHYEEQYDDIYKNYLERMEEFVGEQMIKGRMNRHLKHLYEHFLPKILQNPEMVKYLPNIIFKKKLTCESQAVTGVYVCHGETEEEVYVPIRNGICQVETYSDQVNFYFVDEKSNRYCAGIPYHISRYLNENRYMDLCLEYNLENKKVLLKWTKAFEEKNPDNERIANMVLETSGMKGWMREKAVEQILDYHYQEQALEDLKKCLNQINYKVIRPSYRRTLMNYYMACDQMEDAYFGIELYGSDLVDMQQLYLLTCVGLYLSKGEKDELLITMAHRTFMNHRYNDEILVYLRQYFEGRIFDHLELWEVLKEKNLDTVEYEEKILTQILFTGERDERILDVLLSYLNQKEDDNLTVSMLDIYSIYYFLERKKVPESFFLILNQQMAKKNPLSFMSKLAYLKWKASVSIEPEEKTGIKQILEDFCSQGIVFGFFESFREFFSIPALLREMTWFTYLGETDQETKLSLAIQNRNGQIRQETIPMRQLCSGFYFGGLFLLEGETYKVFAIQDQEQKTDGKIQTETIKECVAGSRKRILGEIEKQKDGSRQKMNQYEAALLRMEEQLTVLTLC